MWGQWDGKLDIEWQGVKHSAICLCSIDSDTPNVGTIGAVAEDKELAPGVDGVLFHLHPTASSPNSAKWTATELFTFDADYRATPSNPKGAIPITIEGTVAPANDRPDVTRLTLDVFAGDKRIGGGTLLDPGMELQDFRLPATPMRWQAFREWAFASINTDWPTIFRGHKSSLYPLVTTFHRSGRRNLHRYFLDNVRSIHHQYQIHTGNRLNLDLIEDYSTLLTIAQHHGYPTPLLDWTRSPFVAAYFAFGDHTPIDSARDTTVRIIGIDPTLIQMNHAPKHIIDPRFCLHVYDLPSHGNLRAVAQQSVYTLATVANIEALLIQVQNARRGKSRFQDAVAIDIPRSDRTDALRDLRYMGINAASIYSGLDGLFRALKEANFPT